jgi:hypothetical protein
MYGPPAEAAAELHETLVEILRQLNRVEMEEADVAGVEVGELRRVLARGAYARLTAPEVEAALGVLVGNGFARRLTDPEYAWDRGRVVGTRYAITTEGKEFLIEQLARVHRVN